MAFTLHTCAATALVLAVPATTSAQPQAEGPVELKFASFFRMPIGARGLEISQTLRNADGRSVRLVGYMVQQEQPVPGRFLLAPRPMQLSEHADGDADDLAPATVTVLLAADQRNRVVVHQAGPVALAGRLQVGRDDQGGRVSWFRLQLEPEALAGPHAAVGPESSLGRNH
jgi:hypothetical protein